jgi:hypothetical protein
MTIRCTACSGGTAALPGEGGGSGGGGGASRDAEGDGVPRVGGEEAVPEPPVEVVVPPVVSVDADSVEVDVVSVRVPVVDVEVVVVDWVELRIEVVDDEVEVHEPTPWTGGTQTSDPDPRPVVATAEARTRRRAVTRTSTDAAARVRAGCTPPGGRPVLRRGLMRGRLSSVGQPEHQQPEAPCPSSTASRSPAGSRSSPGEAAASAAP